MSNPATANVERLTAYLRIDPQRPREPNIYGPKTADHPTVGKTCPACGYPLCIGEYTALVPLGPGEDAENRAKARMGQPYTAVALEVHAACAGISVTNRLWK